MVERVPDDELLNDIRQVAEKLGDTPTYGEYDEHGEYSVSTIESRFGGWTDARAEAGLNGDWLPSHKTETEDLLADLERVAERLDTTPTRDEYDQFGAYSYTTLESRFDTWNDALAAANMEPNKEHNKPRQVYFCSNCGGQTERLPSQVENQERIFCSKRCKYETLHARYSGRGNPNYRGGGETVVCDWCSTELTRKPAVVENQEYFFCDHDCYGQWRTENIVGEDHPRFEEGRRVLYYGPNWHTQKRAARERDGYECQECGITDAEHQDRYDRRLTVHHITPIKEFVDQTGELDHEAANRLENLDTLCIPCHHGTGDGRGWG